MMTYASLPMPFKTVIATLFFLTMVTGICTCILVGRKQGRIKLILLLVCTAVIAAMLLLYASVIRAERAPAHIPAVSLWFEQQSVIFPLLVWLAIAAFFVMVIIEEVNRRKTAITPSSIKESLDHLDTGLCFSQPNGLVMLTNHRMNELSHAIFGKALQNANLFWQSLAGDPPVDGVERTAAGEQPEFRLPDETVWTFRREMLDGAVQITAANTTRQHQLVHKECGDLVSHTIFRTPSKMGKGILVTPTVDGNLLTGPTSVDIEDKEDTSTTNLGFENVIRQAKENVPSIPYHKTITSFCGLRAVGSTGDFIINAPKKGFVNVAAIESPGLTSAPAIAEYVVEILKEQGAELLPNISYNPIREAQHEFREASFEEKNEMIKKDKSFGKIICRCESITEGEILQAIRTNPGAKDLDGIKRRTRAQMGRCQGGFCGPQIVEILAKELGIEYEEVTKSGEGSYINIGKTKEV